MVLKRSICSTLESVHAPMLITTPRSLTSFTQRRRIPRGWDFLHESHQLLWRQRETSTIPKPITEILRPLKAPVKAQHAAHVVHSMHVSRFLQCVARSGSLRHQNGSSAKSRLHFALMRGVANLQFPLLLILLVAATPLPRPTNRRPGTVRHRAMTSQHGFAASYADATKYFLAIVWLMSAKVSRVTVEPGLHFRAVHQHRICSRVWSVPVQVGRSRGRR